MITEVPNFRKNEVWFIYLVPGRYLNLSPEEKLIRHWQWK